MSDDDFLHDDVWDLPAVVTDAMGQCGYYNVAGTAVALPVPPPPKRRARYFLRPKRERLDFHHIASGGVCVGGVSADWWFTDADGDVIDSSKTSPVRKRASVFDPSTLTPAELKRVQDEDELWLLDLL